VLYKNQGKTKRSVICENFMASGSGSVLPMQIQIQERQINRTGTRADPDLKHFFAKNNLLYTGTGSYVKSKCSVPDL
jgi:hypothetical protein